MNNHIVTSATAHALKESGYPQPTPEAGQFWYSGKQLWVVCGQEPSLICTNVISGPWMFCEIDRDYSYAPTATEIMEQEEMQLFDIEYYCFEKTWCAIDIAIRERECPHPNPAEAAAAKYLKEKQNQ